MISRVTALITGFFTLFLGGTAYAMSCMANDEGKAQLCYHKNADGRCAHYGPVCSHSSKSVIYPSTPFKPAVNKVKAGEVNKH